MASDAILVWDLQAVELSEWAVTWSSMGERNRSVSRPATSSPAATGDAPRGRPSGIPSAGPSSPQPLSGRGGRASDTAGSASPGDVIPGISTGGQTERGLGLRRGRRGVSTGRWIAEWLVVLTLSLLAAIGVKTYAFQAFSIPSASMSPTLELGDRVLVSKLFSARSMPDRGDVVVFRRPPDYRPGDPSAPSHLIKRVIGLPGETITSSSDRVMVDGEPLSEPWLGDDVKTLINAPIKVQPGHILVLGDNRELSEDGRFFGTIPTELVEGRAVATVWPLSRLRGL